METIRNITFFNSARELLFSIVLMTFLSTGNTSVFAQCVTPMGLEASEITEASSLIRWNDTPGANYYRLAYKKSTSRRWIQINVFDNSINLLGLASDTKYLYSVRAICSSRRSRWAAIKSFRTLNAIPCPVPGGLFPVGIGSLQATLTWSQEQLANSYDVRFRQLGSTTWSVINDIGTNLTIARGLSPVTDYEFQVRSNCQNGNSPYSNSEFFTTRDNVCVPPTGFIVTTTNTTNASFTWNAVGGAIAYIIQYRKIGNSDWLSTGEIPTTNFTVANLFPGTDYEARIRVNCTLGFTDFTSPISFSTKQITICEQPQNLRATQVSSTFATQNWDPVVGALSYTIRRRISGTEEWIFENVLTDTKIKTFLLIPETTYEFQVAAECVIGNSGFSESSFFTTDPVGTCPIPQNLRSRDITSNSARINWDSILEARSYMLQYRIAGASLWSQQSINFSGFTLDNLSSSTDYEWRVRSNCEANQSEFSEIQAFTTLSSGACPIPTGLFVLGIMNTQATLTWSSVTGALDYNVRYRLVGSISWTLTNNIGTNLVVARGLSSGSDYEFQVQSNCSNGQSSFSVSRVFTTLGTRALISQGKFVKADIDLANISVYPNPVKRSFTIQGTPGRIDRLELFSINGKRVKRVKNYNSKDVIVIDDLKFGLYFLRVYQGQNEKTIKFIKN